MSELLQKVLTDATVRTTGVTPVVAANAAKDFTPWYDAN